MADKTKRRRGRPPVPDDKRRKHVRIVLSDPEREEMDAKAKELGLSRSELVRRAVRAYGGEGE